LSPGFLRWTLRVKSFFLLAVLCAAPVVGSCKEGVEVIWPLSRNSSDKLILKLPPGYAGPKLDGLNTSEMRATDFPVEEDLVITALWPNLEPPATYDFTLEPHGETMQTLVNARALDSYRNQPINALENAFDSAVMLSVQEPCVAAIQASSGPVTRALCQERTEADVKPAKFGLKRLGVDFKKYADYSERYRGEFSQRDVYYLRDGGGSLKTVILCTAEEAKTVDDGPQYHSVGQCEQKFIDAKLNALVSVHYRRVYLQEWREVEAAWHKLLDSFIELRVTNPH
jgi:hypothetical protein